MKENLVKLVNGKEKILIVLFFFFINLSYSQTDSLKYYSKVFQDTNNIFNGLREKAFNYILNHTRKEEITKPWLEFIFGEKETYFYRLGFRVRQCHYVLKFKKPDTNGYINTSECKFYYFRFKGKKMISSGLMPTP